MKSIINNKLYDTNTAELIYSYIQNEPQKLAWSNAIAVNCWRNVDIYKTKKGSYFLHIHQGDKSGHFTDLKERIDLTTEEEIKETIKDLNPDKFIELFGDIEEG